MLIFRRDSYECLRLCMGLFSPRRVPRIVLLILPRCSNDNPLALGFLFPIFASAILSRPSGVCHVFLFLATLSTVLVIFCCLVAVSRINSIFDVCSINSRGFGTTFGSLTIQSSVLCWKRKYFKQHPYPVMSDYVHDQYICIRHDGVRIHKEQQKHQRCSELNMYKHPVASKQDPLHPKHAWRYD